MSSDYGEEIKERFLTSIENALDELQLDKNLAKDVLDEIEYKENMMMDKFSKRLGDISWNLKDIHYSSMEGEQKIRLKVIIEYEYLSKPSMEKVENIRYGLYNLIPEKDGFKIEELFFVKT